MKTKLVINKHTVMHRISGNKLCVTIYRRINGEKWKIEMEKERTAYFTAAVEQIARYTEYDDNTFQLAGERVAK